MRRAKPKDEAALAAAVIRYLGHVGWTDVFQEVTGRGGRADIVARRGGRLWAIECKMRMGFRVLEQAAAWLGEAHLVSVAVPNFACGPVIRRALEGIGVGVLAGRVDDYESAAEWIPREVIRPRLYRNARGIALHEEQKTFAAAGSAGGRHWSPFKRTCMDAVDVAEQHPDGIAIRDLVKALPRGHHYGSDSAARSSLVEWAKRGKVPGVRIEYRGRTPFVIYDPETDERREWQRRTQATLGGTHG